MKKSKEWLEQKVKELNDWLQQHPENHFEYKLKTQNRNYYVSKLIELEESNVKFIKI